MARRRADDDSFAFDLDPDDAPPVAAGTSRAGASLDQAWQDRASRDGLPRTSPRVGTSRAGRASAGGPTIRFDLVPDDELPGGDLAGGDLPGGEELPPSRLALAAAAVGARVRSWPRRRVVAVATVVAVLAAGTVTADVLVSRARQRAWAQVAATTSGAVLDLGHAPVEAARVPVDTPSPVALVGGTLVVQERQGSGVAPLGAAPTLHGIDVATGELVWTTQVATADVPQGVGTCTAGAPDLTWTSIVATRVARAAFVVCLSDDLRRVVVVDGAGRILAGRELDDLPQDEPVVAPGPGESVVLDTSPSAAHRILVTADGSLLRIDRLGTPLAPARVSPLATTAASDTSVGSTTLLDPLVTRDVRVRLEDAVTGRVRWETVLDSADLPAGSTLTGGSMCQAWTGMALDQDDLVVETENAWSDNVTSQRLRTVMCGLDVALDLRTGEVVEQQDVSAPGYAPAWGPSIALPDGGWGELTLVEDPSDGIQDASMHILRDDGSVVGDIPGIVLPPFATDGPSSAMLIASDLGVVAGGGSGVAAYDADDATPLWTAKTVTSARVLVRTADVVVVSDGRVVTGLDRATGAVLWTHEPHVTGQRPEGFSGVLDALTDGRRVVVVSAASEQETVDPIDGKKVTTALDLRTGAVVWTTTASSRTPYAVAGRLFRFDADAVVLLR
ncbi:PQQ-binding-like beta-propeller repeat protein [Xylanimonas protaetiae]|uniref:Pyrrolo-quinoline quinone repeat domain-containing protein n=1 Tax=Xylanimonas protaetiae TaxID=2509457 RepID=A0A4P6F1E6_9MICO|nr:PQQ-binding-like beta-propeller repeat protein [Xylanimonas protaetiae]QAY69046.1 hypothetical protein ET471_02460 [Xylanimonas protaetiae]